MIDPADYEITADSLQTNNITNTFNFELFSLKCKPII